MYLYYMHVVCLGVVKKLILLWHIGPRLIRLSSHMKRMISEALINLRNKIISSNIIEDRDL